MPLAVTHVITSIILVDLYRDYISRHRHYFTLHTVFIAGFAGLLPDIDILLGKVLGFFGEDIMHRTFTHTPLFGLLFLIPGFYFWTRRKLQQRRIAVYFFVTTFGILLHILLDFLFTTDAAGLFLLYPFSMAAYDMNILSSVLTPTFAAGLDAIILLAWLWHEEKKHKISDFI